MRCNWSISAVTLGVTSTEKMRQNYSWSSFNEELYTALRHAHTDKKINVTSTHLCPSFLALLCSICDPPYVFFFNFSSLSPLSFGIYATASSPPIIPLLSFPTHTLLLLCSFFIHSYFTASTAIVSHPIELELFLIIIFLVASICIPPAFLPKGISLLSLTLSPHTPPSFWLVPSRLFSCAIHSSSSPPSQFVSL